MTFYVQNICQDVLGGIHKGFLSPYCIEDEGIKRLWLYLLRASQRRVTRMEMSSIVRNGAGSQDKKG